MQKLCRFEFTTTALRGWFKNPLFGNPGKISYGIERIRCLTKDAPRPWLFNTLPHRLLYLSKEAKNQHILIFPPS